MQNSSFETVAKNLQSHGFAVQTFECAADACSAFLTLVDEQAVIAHGGSVTLGQMGIVDQLKRRGNLVLSSDGLSKTCGAWARAHSMQADVYMTSTNALTQAGEFLNYDGNGNRVAAMFYGPERVFFMVGRNKIVADEAAGLERIKTVACPANAKRLGLDLPCAKLGYCTDCRAPQRFCNIYTRLEHPTRDKQMHVFLIDEDLGY